MIELYRIITISQYVAALRTLEQCIDRTDDETWVADHIDTRVNQVVFHTLFYADLYLSRNPHHFKEQQFHTDHPELFQDYQEWEEGHPTNFYDVAGCRKYLEFCIEKVRAAVGAETEETLAGETGFSWRDGTRAEHHIYNIRHIQHHAAQLGLRHQLAGGLPLEWVSGGE